MFVFVDETGSDKHLSLCRYGYSLKGTRAIAEKTLIRGKRFSAIAAICIWMGLLMYKSQLTVSGEKFCEFIERYLQPVTI